MNLRKHTIFISALSIGIALSFKTFIMLTIPSGDIEFKAAIVSILCNILLGCLIFYGVFYTLHFLEAFRERDTHQRGNRIEKYVLHMWKGGNNLHQQNPISPINSYKQDTRDIILVDPLSWKNRSGKKSSYSDVEKLHAIEKWDSRDTALYPITLEEFLANEFGVSGGVPNVAKSTFYTWRKQFRQYALNEENKKDTKES